MTFEECMQVQQNEYNDVQYNNVILFSWSKVIAGQPNQMGEVGYDNEVFDTTYFLRKLTLMALKHFMSMVMYIINDQKGPQCFHGDTLKYERRCGQKTLRLTLLYGHRTDLLP